MVMVSAALVVGVPMLLVTCNAVAKTCALLYQQQDLGTITVCWRDSKRGLKAVEASLAWWELRYLGLF